MLLVGDYEQADEVANTINQTAGYTCLGLCKVEEIKELRKIILDKKINQIIIFIETIKKEDQSILLELKLSGIEVLTYWKFNEKKEAKIDASHINEEWLLYSNGFDILHDNLQKRAKRFVDLTAALLLALVTLPIMILAAICVKLESKGPIFFKQTRVGLNGIDFTVYKFRSMHLHDENEHSKYSQGNCDKRITFFGKLLRVSRIDELPQLFNVLKGDMSFIGPRPEWDKLGRGYEDQLPYYKIRYLIKPGLTGWAQVMYPYGANLKDTLRKLEYDLYYIKHQNFALDVQIIFKTIKIVLFGKGK
ncbi:MAG: exopolysaccharide biosynthesis polyprenyl glycosylphosphotransferase [Lentisphaeria bacterium]|nr:exopolysaccharide biosynthesis polyprenyl glycosylphosphotransferase [Lentisphaeria bacterium]